MRLDLLHHSQPLSLSIERDGDACRVVLPDGSEHRIVARRLADGMLQVDSEYRSFRAGVARVVAETHVSYDGRLYVFEPSVIEGGGKTARRSTGDLTAPMPGVVADVMVQVGDHVDAYQPLAVVEAMKVMATVEAPFAGAVSEVRVQKGDRVANGEKLMVVTPMALEAETA